MRKVLGCLRRAVTDFHMIDDGDRIAVGVSGGKDSQLLLRALAVYRGFSPQKFELCAVTAHMGLEPFDVTPIRSLCQELNVEYRVVPTEIGRIVFETRQEQNPCSLCANIRRGAVNSAAKEMNCNKVALAHHADDAIETLLMSLFLEGRVHTFAPVTYLSRMDLTVIRPFIYLEEAYIRKVTAKYAMPVITSPCPACGNTKRAEIKQLLDTLETRFPDVRKNLIGALKNEAQYGLWHKPSD
ncbi:MAG: tRNA 2-thiocytidine(32) synthetase TtcA [Eubacteriales bacterium]|nr:tRNA 2-thiocytidine(32) synthetase TtcA [Eubacteriales bacterium]